MYYTWIIDDKLAVAPLPSLNDIDDLTRVFNAVIVLIEPHEAPLRRIETYLNKWLSKGVNVYYAPTPDFHPVDLLELHLISKWIHENIEKNSKVLIHCHAGIGRSGMVGAAYLLYSGFKLPDAVAIVRSRRPGALESISQQRVVEDYDALLASVDKEIFDKHLFFVRRNTDRLLWKHLSKTLQLLIELHEHLNIRISGKTVYASLYHCFSNDYLNKLIEDNNIDAELLEILREDSLESNLIKLAHQLDYYRDSRIVYTDSYRTRGKTIVELYCRTSCSDILSKTNEYIKALHSIKKRLALQEVPYE